MGTSNKMTANVCPEVHWSHSPLREIISSIVMIWYVQMPMRIGVVNIVHPFKSSRSSSASAPLFMNPKAKSMMRTAVIAKNARPNALRCGFVAATECPKTTDITRSLQSGVLPKVSTVAHTQRLNETVEMTWIIYVILVTTFARVN
jgi:hypothetical protein